MNIRRYTTGCALLMALLGLNGCDLKDPLDGVEIVVNADFIKTQMAVSFVDAATGNSIEKNVTMAVSGPSKANVLNIGGRPEFKVDKGIITLALNRSTQVSSNSPVEFTVLAQAPGYLASAQTIRLTDTGMYMYEVRMVNLSDLPAGVTSSAGSVVDNGIVLPSLRSADPSYTYQLINYMATEKAMSALPLPIMSNNTVLAPVAAFHLEIKKNGAVVNLLEKPLDVTLPLTQTLPAGTKLTAYSYENASGQWTASTASAVVNADGKSVTFACPSPAYYWALGTSHPAHPVQLSVTSKAASDEVYTFSYFAGNTFVSSEQLNVKKGNSSLTTMPVPSGAKLRITNFAGKAIYEGAASGAVVLNNESTNIVTFILKARCDNGDIGVQVLPTTLMYFREKGTSFWRVTQVQGGENQLSDVNMGISYEVKVNYDKETYSGDLVPNEHVTGGSSATYEFDFELPDNYC